ncbi:MAG: GSCFA domain-containing protein [Bacteroidales bacterium]|nr:GSCFA domain-containing protein [Candidatus Physcousia equi]
MIARGDSLVMLGSCFAQYMGERLSGEGFDVVVNPLGTLFNPFSIDATVQAALSAGTSSFPLFEAEEMDHREWRCWWANTRWKANTREELEQRLRAAYGSLGAALRTAQHLVVTLGTNVCYRLGDGLVVTNCQRQPDRLFTEWRASLDEVINCLDGMVSRLLAVNPSLQLLFTVSPYRYHKYGYHQSQLSKAVLLLAEDAVMARHPDSCSYFPAYEILLDELRDYVWYAPDKHHPAPAAIDIIYDKFKRTCIQSQP